MTVQLTRTWQSACLEQIRAAWLSGKKYFLVEACPAAGKTKLALALIETALREDLCAQAIVVVPTSHLRKQWTEEAAKEGIDLRRPTNDELSNGLERDNVGYVTTFASVAAWPLPHAAHCSTVGTLGIIDEGHHPADNQEWGNKLKEAFEDAEFVVVLSGTPFRSDGKAIPFVDYGSDGVASPDFRYSYGQSIDDRVCRPISFPSWDGEMEWAKDGHLRKAEFSDRLDDLNQSRRLRSALIPDGGLVRDMLSNAHRRLMAIRQEENSAAAGLIVADDIKHAKALAKTLAEFSGSDPVIAHSDDAEAHCKLRAFRESNAPWLVSVRMVSEGANIPRFRVGVYATCTVAPLFFRQVVGRFVRWEQHLSEEQTAYLYFPADERLLAMAKDIYEQVKYGLRKRKERTVERAAPEQCALFVPLSSQGCEGKHVFDGQLFSREEIDFAREVQGEMGGQFKGLPEGVIALIGRKYSVAPDVEEAVNKKTVSSCVDLDDKLKLVKKEIQNTVSNIVSIVCPYDEDRFKKINNKLNDMAGILPAKMQSRSLRQEEAKLKIAKEWLTSLTRKGSAGVEFSAMNVS